MLKISRSLLPVFRLGLGILLAGFLGCQGLTTMPDSAELDVVSPGTGDHWQVGITDDAVITWTFIDAFGPIKIDLYQSNSFHSNIATAVRIIDDEYTWTVPGTVEPGRGYQVYMESEWDSTLFAIGKSFEVDPYETDAVLTVIQPESNAKWQNGLQDGGVIKWQFDQLEGAVTVVLCNAAEPVATIADSIALTDSTLTWTVPLFVAPGKNYRVFVGSLADPFVGAYSESFEILPSDDPSVVAVSSPGKNDSWQVGLVNAAVVTWTYSNLTGTVKLVLYQDGAFVTTIADSADVTNGSYKWTVPLTVTDGRNFQVYIESNDLPFVNHMGDDFRINPYDSEPALGIAAPNRDAVWVLGQVDGAPIDWVYANVTGTIRIDLYDGRAFYATIADSIDITLSSYLWTVPDSLPTGTRYNIKLTSNELPELEDFSDNFGIQDLASVAVLEVTNPVSGDFWLLGSTQPALIQWYSEYLRGTVQIDLYDNRTLVLTIADSAAIDSGSYSWTVPESMPVGKQYNIRMTSHELPSIEGQSDNFSILDLASVAVLELTGPMLGDIWIIGETDGAPIEWYYEYLPGTIRIDLYDHRSFFTTIADSVDISQGFYRWSVPDTFPSGTRYNLKLVSNVLPAIEAAGDNFNILDLASVAVLAVARPWSGDIWVINEPDGAYLQWHSQYLTGTVSIELYDGTIPKQNPVPYAVIDTTANVLQGSYIWTVPDSIPIGDYSVRVISNELPEITGETISTFTITDSLNAAYLELLRPTAGDVWTVGSTELVEWNSKYLSGTILIELYENPKLEAIIADSVDVAQGSYQWTVTAAAGRKYYVRLQSNDRPAIEVQGENFTIQ
ncbi:MAG: hypothetical protein KAU50_10130 [Candidatus Marinimicrobia bacterium]|nr:hypothetical protein [Candidatus Neomarinimicrobiota bacterium]